MTAKKRNKYNSYDWEALRHAWSKTPASVTQHEFAAKHSLNKRTLQARMKKDAEAGNPWDKDISDKVRNQTRVMQQRIAAGLDKDKPIDDEALAIATAASTNVLVLQTHEELFGESINALKEGFSLVRNQLSLGTINVLKRKRGESWIEEVDLEPDMVARTLNGLTGALERTVKMQRHHLGLDDADSEVSYEDDLKAIQAQIEGEDAQLDDDELRKQLGG